MWNLIGKEKEMGRTVGFVRKWSGSLMVGFLYSHVFYYEILVFAEAKKKTVFKVKTRNHINRNTNTLVGDPQGVQLGVILGHGYVVFRHSYSSYIFMGFVHLVPSSTTMRGE